LLRKKTYISFLVSLLLLIVIDISSFDNLVYGSDDGDRNDKRDKAKNDDGDDGDRNDKRDKAKNDDGDDGDRNDKRETSLEELFESDDENDDDENDDDENDDDENDIPFILPFNAVPFP